MIQLFRDIFYILITLIASLLFLPFTLTIALYAACRAYRDYLSSYMQVASCTNGIQEQAL